MNIYGLDIETQTQKKEADPYVIGSAQFFATIFGNKRTILLPDCEESHELVGCWMLDNIPLTTHIMKQGDTIIYNLEDYGMQEDGQYTWMPPTYFIQLPDWELIASHDVFKRQIAIYFRPRPTWRNNSYASPINLSQ